MLSKLRSDVCSPPPSTRDVSPIMWQARRARLLAGAIALLAGPIVHAEDDILDIRTSAATGVARFVTAADGGAIQVLPAPGQRVVEPIDFLRQRGALFGVTDSDRQLVFVDRRTDTVGRTRTTFQQVHEGVPVFAALLRVHTDDQGRIMAANGTFVPDVALDTTARLGDAEARRIAVATVTEQLSATVAPAAVGTKLLVYRVDLARGVPGPNHLVYEVEVQAPGLREFVYIDAHTGKFVDQITGIHEALHRRVYDGGFADIFLVWSEGDTLPYGDVDVDNLIEYAEDTYNLVASATDGAFLSWDGVDGIMHTVNNTPDVACPNATWNGASTNFCPGVTGDDTVAHEWGHAYTDSTHNLIYQWQPGALNESYSDIFGEVVDLLNGSGTDSPVPLRTDGECSVYGSSFVPHLEVNSPPDIAGTYVVGGAGFNPAQSMSVTDAVEAADDGFETGTDACQPLVGFTAGRIALIDRGVCGFTVKVMNAQLAGASGVIIANNAGDDVFTMGGFNPSITIPSVMVGQADGGVIRAHLPGVDATITLLGPTDVSYRWLHGEDDPSFGGAIRDMWNPNCLGDPGKVSDPGRYMCGTGDNGGVHTNSGVPNHAFALLVDGGTYNGQTIAGIGLTKAFHLYWRAESTYQVPASDFADHADSLEQSCIDLTGVNLLALDTTVPTGALSGEVITTADCAELAKAIAAVELRTEPTQCEFVPMLDPVAPPLCNGADSLRRTYVEYFESGLGGWTVGTRFVADPATFDTPDWDVVADLPDGRAGSAAFVADLKIGNCASDTEAGALYLDSPMIHLPAGGAVYHVAFDHWVATELSWDGGNVKISVNDGSWFVIPSSQFDFNAYPGYLNPPGGNDNPLAGEESFTGANGGEVTGSWGQSQINLGGIALPGDDIRLRFEMGLDGCNGVHGWYVDDVQVYSCCDTFADVACDGSVDSGDYAAMAGCLAGPGATPSPTAPMAAIACLDTFDVDGDLDVDLSDIGAFQGMFDGP